KNIAQWEILLLDVRGGSPVFINDHTRPVYESYNPPPGYTAEEIMKFEGAKEAFKTIQDVEDLLAAKAKYGTLDHKVGGH
ncbi:hypothetical protein H0H87_011624, partial [Tephrocybe sp. NHM501043]